MKVILSLYSEIRIQNNVNTNNISGLRRMTGERLIYVTNSLLIKELSEGYKTYVHQ